MTTEDDEIKARIAAALIDQKHRFGDPANTYDKKVNPNQGGPNAEAWGNKTAREKAEWDRLHPDGDEDYQPKTYEDKRRAKILPRAPTEKGDFEKIKGREVLGRIVSHPEDDDTDDQPKEK
jgi:hypothetical protein